MEWFQAEDQTALHLEILRLDLARMGDIHTERAVHQLMILHTVPTSLETRALAQPGPTPMVPVVSKMKARRQAC